MFSTSNNSLSALTLTVNHIGSCSEKSLRKESGKASFCINSVKSSAVSWLSEHSGVRGCWSTFCIRSLTLVSSISLPIIFSREKCDEEKLYPIKLSGIVLL